MKSLKKLKFTRTALLASFFALMVVFLGCGLDAGPVADGAYFDRNFRYYYVQECRYDSFGPYDCDKIYAVSPSVKVGLRIDSDGLATLYLSDNDYLNGGYYYYLDSEYGEGRDEYGSYFKFYEDETELVVYRNGGELTLIDTKYGEATYFYYDIDF